MAVRGALGASRWEVARPILAESLLLSLGGGALGLRGGVRRTAPAGDAARRRSCRAWISIQLDGGVLLFTMVVSIGVALAFGLLPALHASRADLREQHARVVGHDRQPLRARAC